MLKQAIQNSLKEKIAYTEKQIALNKDITGDLRIRVKVYKELLAELADLA